MEEIKVRREKAHYAKRMEVRGGHGGCGAPFGTFWLSFIKCLGGWVGWETSRLHRTDELRG